MNLQQIKEEARAELEELVQWESPEHETEVEEWLFKLIDRTYRATKEEVREIIKEHGHQQDDDTIWCNMDDVLAALSGTTTSPDVS